MELESTAIAPQTSALIEAARAAASEIELLRHFAVVLLEGDANQAMAMILDNKSLGELAKLAENVTA